VDPDEGCGNEERTVQPMRTDKVPNGRTNCENQLVNMSGRAGTNVGKEKWMGKMRMAYAECAGRDVVRRAEQGRSHEPKGRAYESKR